MTKENFIKKALEIYLQAEIDRKRIIIHNAENFEKWAAEQYDAGKNIDEIL